jgi:hypothetical protein
MKATQRVVHAVATTPDNVTPMPQPIERTTAGLRDFLFHELDAFVRGSTTPERIRSVTQVANAIVDSARLELEFARLVKTRGKGVRTGMPRAVRLVKKQTSRAKA